MKAIKQNDVIDVIYDSIYGYSLEEAFKILEDHRKGAYIPIEWIKQYWDIHRVGNMTIWNMLNAWDEEQARLFEKQITEECTSAERFVSWEKENESRKGEEKK